MYGFFMFHNHTESHVFTTSASAAFGQIAHRRIFVKCAKINSQYFLKMRIDGFVIATV